METRGKETVNVAGGSLENGFQKDRLLRVWSFSWTKSPERLEHRQEEAMKDGQAQSPHLSGCQQISPTRDCFILSTRPTFYAIVPGQKLQDPESQRPGRSHLPFVSPLTCQNSPRPVWASSFCQIAVDGVERWWGSGPQVLSLPPWWEWLQVSLCPVRRCGELGGQGIRWHFIIFLSTELWVHVSFSQYYFNLYLGHQGGSFLKIQHSGKESNRIFKLRGIFNKEVAKL